MSRRIITQADITALALQRPSIELLDHQLQPIDANTPQSPPQPDNYTTKLVKLIPADVVAVFVTLDGIIRSTNGQMPAGLYWLIFAILIVATFGYTQRATRVAKLPPRTSQALLSAVSFVVWVFALGGPFTYAHLEWYKPFYGAILLPLYTFLVPLLFADSAA